MGFEEDAMVAAEAAVFEASPAGQRKALEVEVHAGAKVVIDMWFIKMNVDTPFPDVSFGELDDKSINVTHTSYDGDVTHQKNCKYAMQVKWLISGRSYKADYYSERFNDSPLSWITSRLRVWVQVQKPEGVAIFLPANELPEIGAALAYERDGGNEPPGAQKSSTPTLCL